MTPWQPLPGDDDPGPRPVRDSLPRVAASLGVPSPDLLGAIFGRWEDLVGTAIATHARPLKVREGILVIGVDQPAWATQLSFLGPDLVRRIADATGAPALAGVEVKVVARRPGVTG